MPGAISKEFKSTKKPVQRAERRGTGRRRSNPCFQQQHLRKTPFHPLLALVMCRFVWKQKMWLIHLCAASSTFTILSKHLTCVQTSLGGIPQRKPPFALGNSAAIHLHGKRTKAAMFRISRCKSTNYTGGLKVATYSALFNHRDANTLTLRRRSAQQ